TGQKNERVPHAQALVRAAKRSARSVPHAPDGAILNPHQPAHWTAHTPPFARCASAIYERWAGRADRSCRPAWQRARGAAMPPAQGRAGRHTTTSHRSANRHAPVRVGYAPAPVGGRGTAIAPPVQAGYGTLVPLA